MTRAIWRSLRRALIRLRRSLWEENALELTFELAEARRLAVGYRQELRTSRAKWELERLRYEDAIERLSSQEQALCVVCRSQIRDPEA